MGAIEDRAGRLRDRVQREVDPDQAVGRIDDTVNAIAVPDTALPDTGVSGALDGTANGSLSSTPVGVAPLPDITGNGSADGSASGSANAGDFGLPATASAMDTARRALSTAGGAVDRGQAAGERNADRGLNGASAIFDNIPDSASAGGDGQLEGGASADAEGGNVNAGVGASGAIHAGR